LQEASWGGDSLYLQAPSIYTRTSFFHRSAKETANLVDSRRENLLRSSITTSNKSEASPFPFLLPGWRFIAPPPFPVQMDTSVTNTC
jgi:hypothetical protein